MEEEKDDIIMDDENLDDSVVAEEHQADALKKLKEKLKIAEEKAKEYLDSWQRSQADFVNLRKRDEEAKKEFVRFANENLLKELIPVLDSFNIAISGGHKEMQPVYSQLLKVLEQSGLEELDPIGDSFDPKIHEAVGMMETDNKDDDQKVLKVMQKGYILSGKVIRPAKVMVGEYK